MYGVPFRRQMSMAPCCLEDRPDLLAVDRSFTAMLLCPTNREISSGSSAAVA